MQNNIEKDSIKLREFNHAIPHLDEKGKLIGYKGEYFIHVAGVGEITGIYTAEADSYEFIGQEYTLNDTLEESRLIATNPKIKDFTIDMAYPLDAESKFYMMEADKNVERICQNNKEVILQSFQEQLDKSKGKYIKVSGELYIGNSPDTIVSYTTPLEEFLSNNSEINSKYAQKRDFKISYNEAGVNTAKTHLSESEGVLNTEGRTSVIIEDRFKINDKYVYGNLYVDLRFNTNDKPYFYQEEKAVIDPFNEKALSYPPTIRIEGFDPDFMNPQVVSATLELEDGEREPVRLTDIDPSYKQKVNQLIARTAENRNTLDIELLIRMDSQKTGLRDHAYTQITALSAEELYMAEQRALEQANQVNIEISKFHENPMVNATASRGIGGRTDFTADVWVTDEDTKKSLLVEVTGSLSEDAHAIWKNNKTGEVFKHEFDELNVESMKNNADFEFINDIKAKDIDIHYIGIKEAYKFERYAGKPKFEGAQENPSKLMSKALYNGIKAELESNAHNQLHSFMNDGRWITDKNTVNTSFIKKVAELNSSIPTEDKRTELTVNQMQVVKRSGELRRMLRGTDKNLPVDYAVKSKKQDAQLANGSQTPLHRAVVNAVSEIEGSNQKKPNQLVSDLTKASVDYYDATESYYREAQRLLETSKDISYKTSPEEQVYHRTKSAVINVATNMGFLEGKEIHELYDIKKGPLSKFFKSLESDFEDIAAMSVSQQTGISIERNPMSFGTGTRYVFIKSENESYSDTLKTDSSLAKLEEPILPDLETNNAITISEIKQTLHASKSNHENELISGKTSEVNYGHTTQHDASNPSKPTKVKREFDPKDFDLPSKIREMNSEYVTHRPDIEPEEKVEQKAGISPQARTFRP